MKSEEHISKDKRILLAAESMFAQFGFDGASTREIAREAGVNISMISYYFGSKEKLFEKIFEERMQESFLYTEELIADNGLTAWEKLVGITRRYIYRVQSLRNFYLILQREQLTNNNENVISFMKNSKKNFISIYEKIIAEGKAQGIFKNPSPVEFIHATISGTLFMARNNAAVYAEYHGNPEDYIKNYNDNLTQHIIHLLKYLLGYDQDK